MYSLKEKVIQFLYIDYSKNPDCIGLSIYSRTRDTRNIKEPSVPSIGCCVVVETFVTFANKIQSLRIKGFTSVDTPTLLLIFSKSFLIVITITYIRYFFIRTIIFNPVPLSRIFSLFMGSQLPLKLSLSTSDLSSASIVEPGIIVRTEKSDSSTLPPLTAFVTGFTVPKSIRADNCVNPTSKVVPILTTF